MDGNEHLQTSYPPKTLHRPFTLSACQFKSIPSQLFLLDHNQPDFGVEDPKLLVDGSLHVATTNNPRMLGMKWDDIYT